ncbi:hypothetical protein [Bacillus xiapuensis]|uniref:hypothetical protein n=1 Tax=Bacillus xiapuensis TaxID=2014075 RepID=UPI000C23B3ED|nr:hypothetical protein [Bacillus xiapuensis]
MTAEKRTTVSSATVLKQEIYSLEKQLWQLKQELAALQQRCVHEFKKTEFVSTCIKCGYTESAWW